MDTLNLYPKSSRTISKYLEACERQELDPRLVQLGIEAAGCFADTRILAFESGQPYIKNDFSRTGISPVIDRGAWLQMRPEDRTNFACLYPDKTLFLPAMGRFYEINHISA